MADGPIFFKSGRSLRPTTINCGATVFIISSFFFNFDHTTNRVTVLLLKTKELEKRIHLIRDSVV
jgi:hypothetical protein